MNNKIIVFPDRMTWDNNSFTNHKQKQHENEYKKYEIDPMDKCDENNSDDDIDNDMDYEKPRYQPMSGFDRNNVDLDIIRAQKRKETELLYPGHRFI